MNTENKRIGYFDFLRGIAIIMVVGIHAFSQFTANQTSYAPLSVTLREIMNCGVPIFFALSGFFLADKSVHTKSKYIGFIKKQIPKVYIPVLFWSIPLLMRSVIEGEDIISSILFYFTCGYSVYYFIAVIIQFYLCLPLIQRINMKYGGVILCISMFSAFISVDVQDMMRAHWPLILYLGHGDLWLIFFAMGIWLKKYYVRTSCVLVGIFAVVTFILQMLEFIYIHETFGGGFGYKPTSILFSTAIVLLILHPKVRQTFVHKIRQQNIIRIIGLYSFGIYLIHRYIISIIIVSPIGDYNWYIQWLLILIASTLIVYTCHKLLPKSFRNVIGF